MRIFGLCGEKQCGKNTFSRFAKEALPHFHIEEDSLAAPLKRFCEDYLDLPYQSCWGTDEEKNEPVGRWSDFFPLDTAYRYGKFGMDPISGREILQVVGTDIFRTQFGRTFWLDLMRKKTIPIQRSMGTDVFFIPDVRFRNEVEGLKEDGAKIIRIYRDIPRVEQISHQSETEMATIPATLFDYIVTPDMNTTMDVLRRTVITILRQEDLNPVEA